MRQVRVNAPQDPNFRWLSRTSKAITPNAHGDHVRYYSCSERTCSVKCRALYFANNAAKPVRYEFYVANGLLPVSTTPYPPSVHGHARALRVPLAHSVKEELRQDVTAGKKPLKISFSRLASGQLNGSDVTDRTRFPSLARHGIGNGSPTISTATSTLLHERPTSSFVFALRCSPPALARSTCSCGLETRSKHLLLMVLSLPISMVRMCAHLCVHDHSCVVKFVLTYTGTFSLAENNVVVHVLPRQWPASAVCIHHA